MLLKVLTSSYTYKLEKLTKTICFIYLRSELKQSADSGSSA
jgi:hypothetical protein